MSRIQLVSASLLVAFAGAALAAEVRLGPEKPLFPSGTPFFELGTSLQVARSGDHEIAIWADQNYRIFATFDGVLQWIRQLPAGQGAFAPAVAAGNATFLAAWPEAENDGFRRVVAKRVTFDGRVLDASPIVLWTTTGGSWIGGGETPGIASDGSSFLVSWIFNGSILTIRVAGDGSVGNLRTMPVVTPYDPKAVSVYSPKLVWTGSQFFLGCSLVHPNHFNCCSDGKFPPEAAIAGLPIDTTRTVLPGSLSPLFDPIDLTGSHNVPMAMAFGAGRVTFAWNTLAIAQSTPDGIPLSGPHVIDLTPTRYCGDFAPAIDWDGANFVTAWLDCDHSSVRALRLNVAGEPVDDTPFDVAIDALTTIPPSIVPTPEGVVIVYSRRDTITGLPRAFERSLARLPPQPMRRRGVTR